MVGENDPRPVLRQELARVFKNQRVIRAFEKIFDLIPPEFTDQQAQIDALNLVSELAAAQSVEALDAINRLTDAVEKLAMEPSPQQVSDLVNLSSYPALDTTITVTWTGVHNFNAGLNSADNIRVTADNKLLSVGAGNDLSIVHDGVDTTITNLTGNLIFIDSAALAGAFIRFRQSGLQMTTPNGTACLYRATQTGIGDFFFGVPAGAGLFIIGSSVAFDNSAVADDTRMLVFDVTAGALVRVTRGAANSGGAGFRLLRVPN